MSFAAHPRVYGTAALTLAFVAGVLITLGFKDLYPDLEQRFRASRRQKGMFGRLAGSSRHSSLFFTAPVQLEDREAALAKAEAEAEEGSRSSAVVDGIEGTIGRTPLVLLRSLSDQTGRTILGKAEFLNGAGGSPKDRVALAIIDAAEAAGHIVPGRGDTIYEGTVGSTGISLAALAPARGYCAHIFMPDDQSREKSDLLLHLGAAVERVSVAPITSPDHYVNLARRRAREHEADAADGSRGFFANQFENEANALAHELGTGPEILRQTGGNLSAFVAGAGTGGTIAGVARYLKGPPAARLPRVRIVLSDPQGSGLYNRVRHGVMYAATEREGTRRRQQVDSVVEGIGINRVTSVFDAGRQLIDDAVRVTDEQAMRMARWLAERDGVFVGSSSAVNCVGAVVAAMDLPKGSTVVTILCDGGARHLSKFWKQVGELESGDEGKDLFDAVGIPREVR